MSLLEFFLGVAALSLAGMAITLVPTLMQLKRTAMKAELLIDNLNHDISPLLRSLTQTAGVLENLTSSVNEHVDKIDGAIDVVEDAGRILYRTAEIFRKAVIPMAAEIGGLGAGFRAFIHFFTKPGRN